MLSLVQDLQVSNIVSVKQLNQLIKTLLQEKFGEKSMTDDNADIISSLKDSSSKTDRLDHRMACTVTMNINGMMVEFQISS